MSALQTENYALEKELYGYQQALARGSVKPKTDDVQLTTTTTAVDGDLPYLLGKQTLNNRA